MHEVNRRATPIGRHVLLDSVDQAVSLLSESGGEARLVAGGTDLLIELQRRAHPGVTTLLDLTSIPGLGEIEDLGDEVRIGALVTHNQVAASPVCRVSLTPLAQACREVGAPALRNRATVVGNLVTASPANDTIGPLRALDAWLVVTGPDGTRDISLDRFHTGVRSTVLEPFEVVTHVVVPKLTADQVAVFVKAGLRSAQAISVVNATILLDNRDGIAHDARILLGAVAPTIVSAPGAEDHLRSHPLEPARIAEAAIMAAEGVSPIDDIRASAEHRRHLVRVLVERGLRALVEGTPVDDGFPPLLSPSGTAHGRGDDPGTITVNGNPIPVQDADGTMLLDWLREQAGTTGVKEGCAEGECGACVVLVDGTAVLSCLTPASAMNGRQVSTVEGLSRGEDLHPLQEAFVATGAVQCGFCIPGFLMAGAALLESGRATTRDDILEGLSGNLCRCTGYVKIIEAVETAGGAR